jgi:hypothetical protein
MSDHNFGIGAIADRRSLMHFDPPRSREAGRRGRARFGFVEFRMEAGDERLQK